MFGEKHICGIIILERMLKEKSMKKIMFVFIAIAILFASCSNPIMPTDMTDDRLVGTWTYGDKGVIDGTISFENNGSGYRYSILEPEGVKIEWEAYNNHIVVRWYDDKSIFIDTDYEYSDPLILGDITLSAKF